MSKIHKITIKPRSENLAALTSFNTEILMDGQPLKGVTSFTLKLEAGSVAKINLEMIASVEVDGNVLLEQPKGCNNCKCKDS